MPWPATCLHRRIAPRTSLAAPLSTRTRRSAMLAHVVRVQIGVQTQQRRRNWHACSLPALMRALACGASLQLSRELQRRPARERWLAKCVSAPAPQSRPQCVVARAWKRPWPRRKTTLPCAWATTCGSWRTLQHRMRRRPPRRRKPASRGRRVLKQAPAMEIGVHQSASGAPLMCQLLPLASTQSGDRMVRQSRRETFTSGRAR